jgi:DNA polymerase I-like protein with 3'-5' exonuclease and polymerase domains
MNYEDYMLARRTAGTTADPELDRVARLKLVAKEIAAAGHLDAWLEQHAGAITVITDSADAADEMARLKASGEVIGIDIETAKAAGCPEHPQGGLHPKVSHIRLVQLFQSPSSGVIIIDCFAAGYAWLPHMVGGRYVAHNAQFECSHFWHHLQQELAIECTMLAGRVFHGVLKKLSDLAAEHLDLRMSKALQVSDWSRPELLDAQLLYAAADAVAAKLLWRHCEESFAASNAKYRTAYQFLKALIYPVVRQAGIAFDSQGHAEVVVAWQQEERAARQTLADLGLNDPASVKQKQQWLGSCLTVTEMMDWPQTESGNLSTSSEVLERALSVAGAAPLARWSQVSTRLANFGPALAEKIIEGCLYPNYRIAGMVTGRFGCNNPNIQNQPRAGFKHLYRAPAGHQFVTGDLSQIELRVAGLISGDPVINAAYADGRDLHREVAAERAGKAPGEITKAERQAAKAINFGLIFGAGAKTLRQQAISSYGIDMSLDEALEAKAFFHAKYERLSEWQQEAVADANACGYSESPFIKLTRHYEDRVYTHAMNFPVQSGAWEVLALAMIYIDARLPADGSIRISHHVYDELCLVARDDQVMNAALLLRDGFLHGFQTVFPQGATRGLVEISAGKTWAEAANPANQIKEASL